MRMYRGIIKSSRCTQNSLCSVIASFALSEFYRKKKVGSARVDLWSYRSVLLNCCGVKAHFFSRPFYTSWNARGILRRHDIDFIFNYKKKLRNTELNNLKRRDFKVRNDSPLLWPLVKKKFECDILYLACSSVAIAHSMNDILGCMKLNDSIRI